MSTETLKNLAKACAFVIFADGKIEVPELDSAKALFEKYGLDWFEGETLIKKYLDSFIDASDEEHNDVSDKEISLGNFDLEGIDSFELLKDLAEIIISDGDVSYGEVEVIHLLTVAFGLDPIFASFALLATVANKTNLKFTLENSYE